MLRRLIMVILIIIFINYSYAQVMLITFTSSLVMIFQGWFSPYKDPIVNRLELFNEAMIVINTYFLFLYTDFVPSPEDRYTMGWANIGLLSIMVLPNLAFILIKSIRDLYHFLRLKHLKYTHQRIKDAAADRLQHTQLLPRGEAVVTIKNSLPAPAFNPDNNILLVNIPSVQKLPAKV